MPTLDGQNHWQQMEKGSDRRTANEARSFCERFLTPVDIASLVYFRIAFGAIMLWEVWRYFNFDWISSYWITPTFHFTYWGFGWVHPWPGDLMYLHFYALGLLAVLIALGLFYRLSTTLFFLGFTYVFLLEKARYLNHLHLICLISFLLIFIPTQRAFSLDGLLWPRNRSPNAPAWALWLLRAQIGIVYFYGGVAKLSSDWLTATPMRNFLSTRTGFPLIGRYFTEEWVIYLFAYGGLLLDLLVVPLLLWKKTRIFAFVVATLFHLTNAKLFSIGIFPWFMIAATTLFFSPDWPRRVLGFLQTLGRQWTKKGSAVSWMGDAARGRQRLTASQRPSFRPAFAWSFKERCTLLLLGLYLVVQVLVPLRHFLYPGSPSWTEEGHNFSWHMMLRNKQAAKVRFLLTDPVSKKNFRISPEKHLAAWQEIKMSSNPDMILQFAHHVARGMRRAGYQQIEVRAAAQAALHGRELQLLIDPNVNLAAVQRSLMPASWIMRMKDRSEVDQASR